MKRWLLTLIIPGMLLGGTALAQQEGQADDESTTEGPGRGVARISLMNGDVSVRRGDSGDWVAAAINAPLLAEDRVMTGPGARAEVQFDFYHRIRLSADSEIRLSQLDRGQYQIQVARGLVTFSALKGGDAQVEVSTPGASLRPLAYGNYRISVNPDGTTEFTVRSGEADIYSPRGTQRLRPGRTMEVRPTGANDSEFQMVGMVPRDAWDQFNEQRDRDLARATNSTYQYVSRDVYGAEDLDGYGEWVDVAPYGWSWRPYVASGWAPYRYGRWGWEDYYGWTWISYDPWGWAPYHYGRWYNAGGRWCWYPGARFGARHYWSPALVGWVGWNSWGGVNVGVGFGWGAVGWIPLAPFEPVHRWWGHGYYGGYRNVNNFYNRTTIVNNVNVTNIYRNSRIENGVTVVNGNDFSRGYAGRPMRAGAAELSRANMAHGAVPVAPTRDSLRMSDREVNSSFVQSRSAATNQQRFYARRDTPRVDRVPFETQRQTIEQVATRGAGGRNAESRVGGASVPDNRSGAGMDARRSGEATRGGFNAAQDPKASESRGWRQSTDTNPSGQRPQGATSEWQRFGDPRSGGANNRAAEPAGAARQAEQRSAEESNRSGGWQRFGDPGNRSNTRADQPAGRTGDAGSSTFRGTDSGRPSQPAQQQESNRQQRWSTGGGTGRSESPRAETPRSDSGRWSTGGGASQRMETPRQSTGGGGGSRSESPRMEAPRQSTGGGGGRSESPRMEAPRSAPSGGGEKSREAAPSRDKGRGNFDAQPMARGSWSTGGGTSSFSRGESANFGASRSEPARSSFSRGESFGTGGRFNGGSGYSGNSGSFGAAPRSYSAPSPSYSAPRSYSAPSPSFSAPRSSGSFGGGSSMRSGGGFSGNSGSFGGGGGMRSSGGASSGAARSSGGGGGRSGRGR